MVLGDIVATVPNSAASNYRAKELLELGSIVINGPTTPITDAVAANGIHGNAYFGDVTGDGVITSADPTAATNVAEGTNSGFSAYPLVDPALVGDVVVDYSVDAGDVSMLNAYLNHLQVLQIPPPPGGLTVTITSWY